MTTGNAGNLRLQTQLSLLTIVTGAVLVTWMIVVESEPGALPLGLIAVGAVWFFVTRRRIRARDSASN